MAGARIVCSLSVRGSKRAGGGSSLGPSSCARLRRAQDVLRTSCAVPAQTACCARLCRHGAGTCPRRRREARAAPARHGASTPSVQARHAPARRREARAVPLGPTHAPCLRRRQGRGRRPKAESVSVHAALPVRPLRPLGANRRTMAARIPGIPPLAAGGPEPSPSLAANPAPMPLAAAGGGTQAGRPPANVAAEGHAPPPPPGAPAARCRLAAAIGADPGRLGIWGHGAARRESCWAPGHRKHDWTAAILAGAFEPGGPKRDGRAGAVFRASEVTSARFLAVCSRSSAVFGPRPACPARREL